MAPVILALAQRAAVRTLCTGQHTALAAEPLDWFGIAPAQWLALDAEGRSLSGLTAQLLQKMEAVVTAERPDAIVAQGDTTTVLAAAMTAFYLKIKFAHVEAGLRTGDLAAPFPEEFNRSVAGKLAHWHFCPTKQALANLAAEGVPAARLFLTGNTGIDALRLSLARLPADAGGGGRRRVLLTAHRRENQGERMQAICAAVRALAARFADVEFVVPVHPNPEVKRAVERMLEHVPRVALVPPLGYAQLLAEMRRCHFILTDSGGIQEEAPFLHKPVLVLRDVTERPEAVELGLARLVGTDTETIVAAASELMTSPAAYARMASGASPYGDGFAAERIAAVLTGAPMPSAFTDR